MYDLSVVTLSYNQGLYLKECIESIRDQVNIKIEHIVIDPGSTDGSRSLINQYENITKIFERDDGPADGLNKGFELSSGRICAFLNADDCYIHNSLHLIKEVFDHEDVDIVIAGGYVIDGIKKSYVKPKALNKMILLSGGAKIFQPGIFFKKSIIKKYKFNTLNKTCWDYEFLVDLFKDKYIVKVMNVPLACFRVHENSITGKAENQLEYKRDLDRIFLRETGKNKSISYLLINMYMRIVSRVF